MEVGQDGGGACGTGEIRVHGTFWSENPDEQDLLQNTE
jgi:hypothetical protein